MYTSGVLDAFMDNNLFINNIYAVSAGCYNAVSYLSRQRGRTFRINSAYINDKRYISFKKMLVSGSAVNTDFIFNTVFKELDPFDYDSFKKNVNKFYAVSTDCESGEPYYALIKDLDEDVEYVKASAALPLFTNIVRVNGLKLTDGGVSDSIPVFKAREDGFKKQIIILTRPKGSQLEKNKLMKFNKIRYKKYPKLLEAMANRHLKYNETLKRIEELEEKGNVIVIRPKIDLDIGHLEKDIEKIKRVYEYGYEDGKEYIEKIRKYLGVNKR